jgi:hypothetical protein
MLKEVIFLIGDFADALCTLVCLLQFGNIKLLHRQERLCHPIDLLARPFFIISSQCSRR